MSLQPPLEGEGRQQVGGVGGVTPSGSYCPWVGQGISQIHQKGKQACPSPEYAQ